MPTFCDKASNNVDPVAGSPFRADYLRLWAGVSLHKHRRELVQKAVAEIMREAGLGEVVPVQDEEG